MTSKYTTFDRSNLNLLGLSLRQHDLAMTDVLQLGVLPSEPPSDDMKQVAQAVAAARANNKPILLFMGAHVIKRGLSRYVIDLIRKGYVQAVAMNGACSIHDFELSRIGHTSESVAKYIAEGQFGLWKDTGELNDIVAAGQAEGLGYGEAVGRYISASNFPHKDISIFAAAYESSVPATVHIGIGYDIIHEHPNFNPAAMAAASYRDFLVLAKVMENLEGGVVLCFGTAVMGPEIYLKALAMVRNVAAQQGRSIRKFTSAVFDLVALSGNLHAEAGKDTPEYYYRPFKTILVRTVKDGGQSFYIRGDHRSTLPTLHSLLVK